MRYRLLGRSSLLVSELCLGTMTYGGKGRERDRRREDKSYNSPTTLPQPICVYPNPN